MLVFKAINPLRKQIKNLRARGKTIGFIPTMGALHEGHLSLIKKARQQNDIVVLSIYVNPTQFGPKEDFNKYPRTLKDDKLLAETCGVDLLFLPNNDTMYTPEHEASVSLNGFTKTLCGKTRPGHFKGVTTVVSKLLNIVTPDTMYLGQKDAQQAVILKKMVADLNFDVKVIVCPILREKDGLAMSSRNVYLNDKYRRESTILYQSLKEARQKIKTGEKKSKKIIDLITKNILNHTHGKIDYIACVDAETLKDVTTLDGKTLIALAVKFGSTRLIDNIVVNP